MPRALLILPTAGYRTEDFLAAASALDVEVVVATDRRQTIGDAVRIDLAGPTGRPTRSSSSRATGRSTPSWPPTMSCSSRAIRARSSATAMRAVVSRSRSAWVARTSAASACSSRASSAYPASQQIPKSSGMKTSSPVECPAWL